MARLEYGTQSATGGWPGNDADGSVPRLVPEDAVVLTNDGLEGWDYTANALEYVANTHGDYTATLHMIARKIREQTTPEPTGFATVVRDDDGEIWQRVTDTNTWFSRKYGGHLWFDGTIRFPVAVVYEPTPPLTSYPPRTPDRKETKDA
jgi:hypothetical protein